MKQIILSILCVISLSASAQVEKYLIYPFDSKEFPPIVESISEAPYKYVFLGMNTLISRKPSYWMPADSVLKYYILKTHVDSFYLAKVKADSMSADEIEDLKKGKETTKKLKKLKAKKAAKNLTDTTAANVVHKKNNQAQKDKPINLDSLRADF